MTDEPHHDIDELAERVAELEAQQQELAEDQEQVLGLFERFKKGVISRRTFLSSVAAIGGIGLATNAQAAPSWGSASGNSGTSAAPLSDVYSQTGTFQTVSTGALDISGSKIHPYRHVATLDGASGSESTYSFGSSQTRVALLIDIAFESDSGQIYLRLNGDTSGGYDTRLTDGSEPTFSDGLVLSDEDVGRLNGWIEIYQIAGSVVGVTGDLINFDLQQTLDQGQWTGNNVINSFTIEHSAGSTLKSEHVQVFTIENY